MRCGLPWSPWEGRILSNLQSGRFAAVITRWLACACALTALLAAPHAHAADATLWIQFIEPNGGNSIRQGQSASFSAVLVKADGTVVDPVAATWSITSGPASVDGAGNVTGGAVGTNTPATLMATYMDPVLTNGVMVSDTRPLTIQASQDHWTGGTHPGQGGDVRGSIDFDSGTTTLISIFGGGIYRSSNGTNWIPSSYGIPFRSSAFVRNMLAVPNTTTQALASVEGAGIYRSSDKGVTWTPSNTGMGCNFPRGYSASGSLIYVASECGVFKSSDGGATWMSAGFTQRVQSVTTFSNGATIWANTLGNGLYRSTNGGATWTQRNNGLSGPNGLQAYAFRNLGSNVHLAMIEGSGIFKSNDSGANWALANTGLPGTANNHRFASGDIRSPGDGYLYVSVEGSGIYRGTTGANVTNAITWSAWGNSASQLPLHMRPPDINFNMYYVATGQGLYRSSDNGATFTRVSNGLPGGFARGIVIDPGSPATVYTTADTVYKSIDAGTTWARADTGLTSTIAGPRGSGGTIVRRSDGALYVSTGNGGIWKSVNNAASWAPVNTGLPTTIGQGVTVRGGVTSAPQTLYALFSQDARGIYRTLDGGANWTNISGNLAGNALYTHTVAADPATGHLYLGTEGGLYKSVNNGSTWTLVHNVQPVDTVRVDTGTVPSTVYWSTYIPDALNNSLPASGLYRSADGGAITSQLLSGYLVQSFRVVRPGGALRLYAAIWSNTSATGGVLKSMDGGASWQTINAGRSHPYVGTLDVVNEQIALATTRGGGIYSFAADPASNPPAAPTGLVCNQVPATTDVSVSWAGSPGATSYNIYKAKQTGVTKSNYGSLPGGQLIAGVFSPATMTNNGAGTTYFVVTAVNASGESAESAQCSVNIPDTASPSTPAGVSATPIAGQCAVNVGWNASSDNVGVTRYDVRRNGIFIASVTGTPPATGYIDSGLAANTTYSYTVIAFDAANNFSGVSTPAVQATTGPSCGTPVALESGFNLLGNAFNATINVPAIFGSLNAPVAGVTDTIISIWKWNAAAGRWAFYSPQRNYPPALPMDAGACGVDALSNQCYAFPRSYDLLTQIDPGEGFWVNSIEVTNLILPGGGNFTWHGFNYPNLPAGFNLISTASPVSPSQFNLNVNATPPQPGEVPTGNFVSLWAWNAQFGRWYFYSPILESTGGLPAVKAYADSHNYLHFQDDQPAKTLGPGVGFWVNSTGSAP